ncbi:hypothetical protein F0562_016055 [Nyssa sinensis]|uniref:Uncharacterized protein n=1 Tax=Nyssa sinensis TaxID=561372 RepID=A0A5J4ZND8_9ASTE|nr:hypothetical protein F0562_016055 [Nyssa sinensis]
MKEQTSSMASQNSNESVYHHDLVSHPSKPQKAHHHDHHQSSSSSSKSQSPKPHELDKDYQTVVLSQSKNPKSPRRSDDEEAAVPGLSEAPVGGGPSTPIDTAEAPVLVEDTGRERLKRHRVEVAGSARAALVQEGRRASSTGLRIGNRC